MLILPKKEEAMALALRREYLDKNLGFHENKVVKSYARRFKVPAIRVRFLIKLLAETGFICQAPENFAPEAMCADFQKWSGSYLTN